MISVLLTSPLVGRHSAERAAALAAQCDLIVAIDHCDGVDDSKRPPSPPEHVVRPL